jgi:enolase
MTKIQTLIAREIFDSRGTPTVEVDLVLDDGSFGRAAVPSGASTGVHEATELRDDGDKRLGGKGVRTAVKNVTEVLLPELKGLEAEQRSIDNKMIAIDGTPNKGKVGANAILGVSMALSKALAISQNKQLWEYFRGLSSTVPSDYILPVPMMNILNGGKHATNSSDFQEFMIMPVGATSFRQAMDMGASVFMALKKLLGKEGFSTTVGDEGGFAPSLGQNEKAIEKIKEAVEHSGYVFGKDIVIAMDVASSEFYENGNYILASEKRTVTPKELADMYEEMKKKFPIASIEDPFDQDAWEDYTKLTSRMGKQVQIVGDDLFVTNVTRLQKGIDMQAANAILIKLNQIGTVTETVDAIDLARKNGYKAIVSHRSGETEDTTIADFVVGLSTGQIKTGSMSRTDRVAKYNQLLRIEETLGNKAVYLGLGAVAR